MPDFETLEPAIDPSNKVSFLLDWEVTMKCNLDCSYCGTGLNGGHDNTTRHPPVDQCLASIDFMFEYVDQYMQQRPRGLRYVFLNVYGGESLHHPDIVQILSQVRQRYEPYQSHWHLTVTTTTNAIVSDAKLKKIIPYIDEFTVSYHPEATPKQKQQFKNNLLAIRDSGKRQKCVVLMHQDPELFNDAELMMSWLTENNIKILPKQLDSNQGQIYSSQQVQWFDSMYQSKSYNASTNLLNNSKELSLTDTGRSCCGGRQLCQDKNYKQRHAYVENKFPNWYCSVNHFFLYVRQVTNEVFVNKDCKMTFDQQVGPIGSLERSDEILAQLKTQLTTGTMPVIQCKKDRCWCGLCAPKAADLDTYYSIMKKYSL